MILDGREQGGYQHRGSFLLVDERSDSRRVLFVRDGDFMTFAVVKDPVGAIDEHVAHVLQSSEQPIDFSPRPES